MVSGVPEDDHRVNTRPANELTIHILAAVIRSRRAAAIFMASRDRVPTNTSPSASIRNIIIGMPASLVGSLPEAVFSELSETESAGASAGTVGSCALTVATAGRVSGHATGVAGAGAAAWAAVCDEVLICGAGTSGDDAVLSVVALLTGAALGLTAPISTRGEDGPVSRGLTGIGAPSAAGFGPNGAAIECKGAAGPTVAGGAACCTGWLAARTYQHLR
jgi:hypothetical protein